MEMFVLSLIFLAVTGVCSDGHFLNYYRTVVSPEGPGLPEFFTVGYVNDQQIEIYTSDNRSSIPKAQWVQENEDPNYWKGSTQNNERLMNLLRSEFKLLMIQMNHTEGFHFVQMMCGCLQQDDGSSVVYEQYRYDGREFMHLDVQTATYIPIMAAAQITTQKLNSPDIRMGERAKYHLENVYVERLKRYVEFGKDILERKVRPRVKVTGRVSGNVTKLHCQVYGFHPRPVDVMWMKNGEDEVPPYETTHVLPNPDGTYQIRVSSEVIPKVGDRYSCYVDHSSLEEPLLVQWEPKRDFPVAVIISVVVVIIILIAAVLTFVGVIIYKKKKENLVRSGGSDTSISDVSVTASL